MKARDLADESAGISEILGDRDIEITHIASVGRLARGGLAFLKAGAAEYSLADGVAVICREEVATRLDTGGRIAILVSDNPRLAFMRIANRHFPSARPAGGVHPLADVHPSSTVDPTASVGAFCFVGPDCSIGSNSVLHPHVTLYEKVRIGSDVIVHGGTVIGADGFGYERRPDGGLEKFPHVGGVIVEDAVEIGSNTSIDRGSLEDTILRQGCKVDNQVHVAHNVEIGEDAVVIAQSMVGGSVRIGPRAWLAPAAVVMNQVRVGADATVGLGAVVTKDVADDDVVMGSPALPQEEFRRLRASLKALADGR